MFSPQQLGTLLEMQNDMQCAQLGHDWIKNTAHNYGRAIAVEACEAMDHVGFKWWKDKEPDMEQLKMELVDILHFELCLALQAGETHTDRSAVVRLSNTLCEDFDEMEEEEFSKTRMLNLLDEIAVDSLQGDSIFYVLMQAFKLCGLTGDDAFKLYVGKNVLNTFRKNNGYKDGTYTKVWAGTEDNEVLTRILEGISGDVQDMEFYIYTVLDDTYKGLGLKL